MIRREPGSPEAGARRAGVQTGIPVVSDDIALNSWLIERIRPLERAYLARPEPWQQSGFSGPEERWAACRKPVAECLDRPGTFLDIGCANGYLLECVVNWKREQGVAIEPFGLDIGDKLVARARMRLPRYADNFYRGNAWDWPPPRRFDYVRTELAYLPPLLQRRHVARLLEEFVAADGRLLVAEYRSGRDPYHTPWVDDTLRCWRMNVALTASGLWQGRELTRVAVIDKKTSNIV
jgi:SAM-dependent methyltransferase